MTFDRAAVLAATDLRSLADELLGPRKSGRSGWRCPNPDHPQTGRTPPVSIFGTPSGERWRCHGCGTGGTAIDLLVTARNLKIRDALEVLAGRAGITASQPWTPRPPAPRQPAVRPAPPELVEPDGLREYVDDCARRLWLPAGRPVRDWLTRVRGIPADVLRVNRIGADPGRRIQPRPNGVPRVIGPTAVFPVLHEGLVVYAQLRPLFLRDDLPKNLNVASRLARNPKLALYEPVHPVSRCRIITEGPTDGLSAAAGGYPAAVILAARYADDDVADRLANLGVPLLIAFDPDQAGQHGSAQLAQLLRHRHRTTPTLHVTPRTDDLNAWLLTTDRWPAVLQAAVLSAMPPAASKPALAIGM